jgi:hypothetical protein
VPPEDEEIEEGVWKEVQLIAHLSIPDLNKVMAFFGRSLDVNCDFCHDEGLTDFSADTNPRKETSRTMIRMVQGLNQDIFGADEVSCYTCHRAEREPLMYPRTASSRKERPAAKEE